MEGVDDVSRERIQIASLAHPGRDRHINLKITLLPLIDPSLTKFHLMDFYVPSSPCVNRKLATVAFRTLCHYLLSKQPSALLKFSKDFLSPVASTGARSVHRHQAIVFPFLYHSKHIHCLLPKAAPNDAILFARHAFARTRSSKSSSSSRYARGQGAEQKQSCVF